MDVYTRSTDFNELKDLETSSVKWTSAPVSYGVLYSNEEDYTFFGRTIIDNSILMKSCLMYASISNDGSVSATVSLIILFTQNSPL